MVLWSNGPNVQCTPDLFVPCSNSQIHCSPGPLLPYYFCPPDNYYLVSYVPCPLFDWSFSWFSNLLIYVYQNLFNTTKLINLLKEYRIVIITTWEEKTSKDTSSFYFFFLLSSSFLPTNLTC